MDRQHRAHAWPQDQVPVPEVREHGLQVPQHEAIRVQVRHVRRRVRCPGRRRAHVQVFTANYSRTCRLADRPFPVKALDTAYIAKSQQNAIRRLDVALLRPVLETHLVTGEPWWGPMSGRTKGFQAATVSG